jgi:hypothetical protein
LAGVFGATVRTGVVPDRIDAPVIHDPALRATSREALVEVPGVARFHVVDGREVIVDLQPTVSLEACLVWLHGLVAAVVLSQQGRFALHASAVQVDSAAVAVAGRSGAGKSTTAAALGLRGHALLTDEVTALDLNGRRPVIDSSLRGLRLRPATALRLGLAPIDGTEPVDPLGKTVVALPCAREPAALDQLVVLATTPLVRVPTVEILTGLRAVLAVRAFTYRPRLTLLAPGHHHEWAAAVGMRVPVVRILRPESVWTVDAVADLIESVAQRAFG